MSASAMASSVPSSSGLVVDLLSPSYSDMDFSLATWRRLDEAVGQRSHDTAEGRAFALFDTMAEGLIAVETANVVQGGIIAR